MVAPVPQPAQKPAGGRCCITCGVLACLFMLAMTFGTWRFARWLEQSGEIDKLLADQSPSQQATLESPIGTVRPLSERWMALLDMALSRDGRTLVYTAMPRFSMVSVLKNPPPTTLNPGAKKEQTQEWLQQLISPRLVAYDTANSTENEITVDFGTPAQIRGDIALTPDGKRVAVSVMKPKEGETQDGESLGIWSIDLTSGKATKLVNDGEPRAWSPDGTRLAYKLYDPGKEREQIWTVQAGEAPRVALDMATAAVRWSSDGRRLIALVAGPSSDAAAQQLAQLDISSGKVTKCNVSFMGNAPSTASGADMVARSFVINGAAAGNTKKTSRIALLDLNTGQTTWVGGPFEGNANVVGVALGGRVVILTRRTAGGGVAQSLWALYLADGKFRPLVSQPISHISPAENRLGNLAVSRGRSVYFSTSPNPDDAMKMMLAMFFGNGFGETLQRLDIDEAKLKAIAGSATPGS